MIDIKVKTKKVRFSVPIPYGILNLGVSVVASNLINRLINQQTKKYNNDIVSTITIPPIDKKVWKQIIHELKQHKGTELVYVKARDGSEIRIRL
jgi:hypothetical protein